MGLDNGVFPYDDDHDTDDCLLKNCNFCGEPSHDGFICKEVDMMKSIKVWRATQKRQEAFKSKQNDDVCNQCGKRKEGTTHDQLMATAKLLKEAVELLSEYKKIESDGGWPVSLEYRSDNFLEKVRY